MSKQQGKLMAFDPASGEARPYPSHAQQWRDFHGADAWLWNPWTGERRGAGDVGSDPFGFLIVPQGEPIYAGQPADVDAAIRRGEQDRAELAQRTA